VTEPDNIDRIAARVLAELRVGPGGITEEDLYELALSAAREGVKLGLASVLSRIEERGALANIGSLRVEIQNTLVNAPTLAEENT
jgi:hypothetical protein